MTHEAIPIEKEKATSVHVLTGILTAVYEDDGTVDVTIDGHGDFSSVPVFYHCQGIETADGMPFIDGDNDRVVIVNYGDPVNLSVADMKVVGFEDGLPRECPVETVYVMVSGQCFVWDIAQNQYATVPTNSGEPASFPCPMGDISDWRDSQINIGSNLIQDSDCGREIFSAYDMGCVNGDWGYAGSSSDSVSAPSDCGCGFDDTGECLITWDLTMQCHPTGGSWWINAGWWTVIYTQNILWEGLSGETDLPQKVIFLNNSGVQNAFRIELEYNKTETFWNSDGGACGGAACDNTRQDVGNYSTKYKLHSPIATNMLEIDNDETKTWDDCNDLGAQNQINHLLEMKLVERGRYSDKTIVQAYTVEAKTVNRDADCATNPWYGGCHGPECVGDVCPWQNEEYTTYGLEVAAQVGFIPGGTDGVDPTGLQRNSDFENAIKATYNEVRNVSGIPDDELVGINLSTTIYKGTS